MLSILDLYIFYIIRIAYFAFFLYNWLCTIEKKSAMEIRLNQISKSFEKGQVIKPTSLTIESGSFTTLLGPSDCGKMTLLHPAGGYLLWHASWKIFQNHFLCLSCHFWQAPAIMRRCQSDGDDDQNRKKYGTAAVPAKIPAKVIEDAACNRCNRINMFA